MKKSQSELGIILRGIAKDPLGLAGLIIVSVIVFASIFAVWIVPYDPVALNIMDRMQSPSWTHLLGTDQLGRDTFSRVVMGGQVALKVALPAVFGAMFIGLQRNGRKPFHEVSTNSSKYIDREKMMKMTWMRTQMDRRNFLRGATALSAAATLPMNWPKSAQAADGDTLRVRSYGDQSTMDPAYSLGVFDEDVHANVYNKLIQYKPGSEWGWQLDAASMIEQVDPTHVKFALRDDIGFTNGFGAMTAEDVKFSLERYVDDATESPNKPDLGPLSHVEVTGEREGVIVLNDPFAPLWSIALPYITGNIISKKAIEASGGRFGTDPVAESGPYLRASWSPKEKIVLKRNPDWKGEAAAWENIEILPIDDENTSIISAYFTIASFQL